jgi:hypothetical protein
MFGQPIQFREVSLLANVQIDHPPFHHSAETEVVAMIPEGQILHEVGPQLLKLFHSFFLPEFPFLIEKFIAHFRHFVIEIDNEHLLFVEGHEQRHLQQTTVFAWNI